MKKSLKAIVVVIALMLGLSACSMTSSDYDKRKEQNKTTLISGDSQEQKNLREKIRRDEASADKIGYVYVMTFGKFIGYYTIKGKISSDGSQLNPQDDIICRYSGDSCQSVDGPQDDNTYGDGDPGVFFFTTEGAMVVTSLDYLYSDQPIAASVDVPKLNK